MHYQNIGDVQFLCMISNKPDEIKLVGEGC